ncbi:MULTISPECIES: TetR/AcrR family transcriptional regulator [unclassified Knoellia]|uniref:TetR/AcrR family transcriptional regulator n=1 Tax=Knoellia altitudinis TaxID=3404795 RepID=UPI00361D4B73
MAVEHVQNGSSSGPSRPPRGEATRDAIAAAAQELFLERGYDRTTMRAVAERAGVSVGNAYYWFASKEHLVQAFYDRIQVEHAASSATALGRRRTFASRYEAVLLAWVDVAEPFHEFAGAFFKAAAEPTSPLSPFSPESRPAREAAIALHQRVVEESDVTVARALREELPELLWLAQMGVVLFWVHDQSPGQRRTRTLIRTAVPLVDRLVRLSRLPGMRGVVGDLTKTIRSVRT